MLITGASSGIGRAVAVEASRLGAHVAIVGRRDDALSATLTAMDGTGHLAVNFDLSRADEIPEMMRTVSDELGGLDVLVHSAGMHNSLPLRSVKAKDATSVFGQNVTPAIMLAKGFRQRQIPKQTPSIVFLSSAVGIVGQPGVSLYSASKGAIISLTKSLALELAREGIRVNCVCPGVVNTEMTAAMRSRIGLENFRLVEKAHPLGLGEPQDVSNAILFLASDASRWMTGSSLVVDGGYTAQ